APVDRRRPRQQANRRQTVYQYQDGGETPTAAHGQAGNSRRGRPHPLRHSQGNYREPPGHLQKPVTPLSLLLRIWERKISAVAAPNPHRRQITLSIYARTDVRQTSRRTSLF